MRVIYSTQRADFLPGYEYRNPAHFRGPQATGVSELTVVGNWPAVVNSYRAIGMEVTTVGALPSNDVPALADDPFRVVERVTDAAPAAQVHRAAVSPQRPDVFSDGLDELSRAHLVRIGRERKMKTAYKMSREELISALRER